MLEDLEFIAIEDMRRRYNARIQELEAINAELVTALKDSAFIVEWVAGVYDVPPNCDAIDLCGNALCENFGCICGKITSNDAAIAKAKGET